MATFTTQNRGNLAIETHIWEIPVAEARAAQRHLDMSKGGYWENNLAKPCRRAVRAKSETVKVYTAGFSTSRLSNALFNAGCKVTGD